MDRHTIRFNIFRPSGDPNSYTLIGNNSLLDARPSDGRVTLDVSVVEQISVQPGDVVGVHPMSNDDDNGIEIGTANNTVTVWYTPQVMWTFNLTPSDGNLPSSTVAAPVITAVVGKWNH